jgi:predicted amidophosphoribosyltransferase
MIQEQESGINGIFPIFISYSSTHRILVYWKNYGGSELRKILFSPVPELLGKLKSMNFEQVIPIPQNHERSLKRGHASALEVGHFFSSQLEVPLRQNLELKKINVQKQASLNEWERRHSESPFICKPLLPNVKKILIVDDFITTGSTLDKAANAIHSEYPQVKIYAASLGWKPKILMKKP